MQYIGAVEKRCLQAEGLPSYVIDLALADPERCGYTTEHPFCMSTFLGLDNRELLLPFMPVY